MAEINLGNIRFNWRGIFQLDAEYIKNDVVSYKGSSYVAFKNCTSELPTNAECWGLMVEGIEDVSKIQQAYDLANGALPVTGGTVTGDTDFKGKLQQNGHDVLTSELGVGTKSTRVNYESLVTYTNPNNHYLDIYCEFNASTEAVIYCTINGGDKFSVCRGYNTGGPVLAAGLVRIPPLAEYMFTTKSNKEFTDIWYMELKK